MAKYLDGVDRKLEKITEGVQNTWKSKLTGGMSLGQKMPMRDLGGLKGI